MKKNMTVIFIILLSAVIIDTSMASKFGVYLTVLCIAFVMVKFPFKEEILVSTLTGLIMDIFFSAYIGPITITFFLISLVALIVRSSYKIEEFTLFYVLIILTLVLIFLRMHFVGFTQSLIATAILGIPVYLLLNTVFKNKKMPEML